MKVVFHAALSALMALALTACQKNEVKVKCADYTLRLQVVSPEIIRVSASPDGKFQDRQSLVVLPQAAKTDFEVSEAMGKVHLTTDKLAVDIYKVALAVIDTQRRRAVVDHLPAVGEIKFCPLLRRAA